MIKKILLVLFLLSASLLANKTVTATATIDRADYADKSIENLQKMAIQQAKLNAASQLFGDFIKSDTVVKDGSLVRDLILAKQGGIVHIEGNPLYENGQNLGELKVSIKAYATAKDIEDMQVKRLVVSNFMYSNRDLTIKQLEQAAKDAFIVEAIAQKKPSIKTEQDAAKKARALVIDFKIEKMDFSADWLAYKLSGYVEYVPIFLRSKSNNKQGSIQISKNKMQLFIYSGSGKQKTFIIPTGKKILLDKKILSFIASESQKNPITMNLHAKFSIPKEIKTDTVTIQANNKTQYSTGSYFNAFINGTLINKGESSSVNVINDNGTRYVKLNITLTCRKGDFNSYFQEVLHILGNVSYKIIDFQENLYPFIIKSNQNKGKIFVYSANGNTKNFDILYNTNGFILPKKAYKFISNNSQKNPITMNLHAKFLIPKEIKTDTVTIQANNKTQYSTGSYFNAFINGTLINKGESSSVNVI
ncbi:hypothetical protein JHD47_06455, partial [Sulfurimonas sp. SAG-AH-194-L11]